MRSATVREKAWQGAVGQGGRMGDEVEERLPGGNVGGAVRVGDTVRRPVGPWTPAVHALLAHLDGRLPHVPQVLGLDECGREVLTFLPGHVVDLDRDVLTLGQVTSLVRWTRELHAAVGDFVHPGPWRMFPVAAPTLVGHNDIAAYNVVFDGEEVAGVFDWDLAGPTTPLMELAFLAWNAVPLWTDVGAPAAAERLTVIAETYGGVDPRTLLRAVPVRIQIMLDGIPASAAAGDAGMANLMTVGEPERSRLSLEALESRIPGVLALLG